MDLYEGDVNAIDLVNDDSNNPGVGEVAIYGGRFYLSRDDDDEDVEIGQITIKDGLLDMTTGSNASNGKTIGKLIVEGGYINLDVNNILVKEEIEVYAAPSSLTFYDGLNVVWKPPKADLNQDGIVNFLDLAILSEHWLEGK